MRTLGQPAPWPDVEAARRLLAGAAALAAGGDEPGHSPLDAGGGIEDAVLARWLARHQLAPLVYAACHRRRPALARLLRRDAFSVVAGNLAHFDSLSRIEAAFAAAGIPVVTLKGAALAASVYGDPGLRSMSDVDLWVREDDMAAAADLVTSLGFRRVPEKPGRPFALERLAGGEVQFLSPCREHGLVELHFSPFPGWWARRTAAVDVEEIWRRTEPLAPDRHARRLAAEDAIIVAAFHLAVSGQFSHAPLRGLVDIALIARSRPVEWPAVARRARTWRLATVVACVLDLVATLPGAPGVEIALAALRPARLRRRLLKAWASAAPVLAGRDWTGGPGRYLLLLLLADRRRDMARLAARTVWPDKEWLGARHGGRPHRLRHLARLLTGNPH